MIDLLLTSLDWMGSDRLAALVRAHLDGDADATTELVQTLEPPMLRYATAIVRDPVEAEDVVIEAMMSVLRNLPNVQPEAVLRYARRAVRSRGVDFLRRPAYQAARRGPPAEVTDESFRDDGTLPEGKVAAIESDRVVREIVAAEADDVQEALRMHFGMAMSYSEIAEALDKHRSWVARAIQRVRGQVAERILIEEGGA